MSGLGTRLTAYSDNHKYHGTSLDFRVDNFRVIEKIRAVEISPTFFLPQATRAFSQFSNYHLDAGCNNRILLGHNIFLSPTELITQYTSARVFRTPKICIILGLQKVRIMSRVRV